jgi:hypothetical protein
MAFASSVNTMWEVVEPQGGTGVLQEFLDKNGEGVYHVGFHIPGRNFTEAIEEFSRRGFQVVQSGRWLERTGYAFIGTGDGLGVFFEIWDWLLMMISVRALSSKNHSSCWTCSAFGLPHPPRRADAHLTKDTLLGRKAESPSRASVPGPRGQRGRR